MVKGKLPSYTNSSVDEGTMRKLEHLVSAHVDSFNYFVRQGLETSVADISPMEMTLQSSGRSNGEVDTPGFAPYVKLYISEVDISLPSRKDGMLDGKLTPREARERHITYSGLFNGIMHAVVEIEPGIPREFEFPVKFGNILLILSPFLQKCLTHFL